MGYSLTIGEFKCEVIPSERYASLSAEEACEKEAPGAPLDSSAGAGSRKNCCMPSYSAWGEFTRRHGLYEAFAAGSRECLVGWWVPEEGVELNGLIASHPGVAALTAHHLKAFIEARDAYLATAEPRWGLRAWHEGQEESKKNGAPWYDPGDEPVDYDLRRLEWLVFWTDWALEHCKFPTFENG